MNQILSMRGRRARSYAGFGVAVALQHLEVRGEAVTGLRRRDGIPVFEPDWGPWKKIPGEIRKLQPIDPGQGCCRMNTQFEH